MLRALSKIGSSFVQQATAKLVQVLLAAAMSAMSVWLILPFSSTVAYLCATCFACVTFVAPAVLVWAQRYKKCASLSCLRDPS